MYMRRVLVAVIAIALAVAGGIIAYRAPTGGKGQADLSAKVDRFAANSDNKIEAKDITLGAAAKAHSGKDISSLEVSAPVSQKEEREKSHIQNTQLPAESMYLDEGGINTENINSTLKSDAFNKFIEDLSQQGFSEQQAVDVTRLYSSAAQDAAKDFSSLSIERVACGMKLCAIEAIGSSGDDFNSWFEKFLTNPSGKVYATARYEMANSRNSIEYRLIFSTDPINQAAVSMPAGNYKPGG